MAGLRGPDGDDRQWRHTDTLNTHSTSERILTTSSNQQHAQCQCGATRPPWPESNFGIQEPHTSGIGLHCPPGGYRGIHYPAMFVSAWPITRCGNEAGKEVGRSRETRRGGND